MVPNVSSADVKVIRCSVAAFWCCEAFLLLLLLLLLFWKIVIYFNCRAVILMAYCERRDPQLIRRFRREDEYWAGQSVRSDLQGWVCSDRSDYWGLCGDSIPQLPIEGASAPLDLPSF